MDLTIDTPPETPMEPSGGGLSSYQLTSGAADTPGTDNGDHPPPTATFTSHTQKKSNRSRRTQSAFTWHYDPSPKPVKSCSQDIPENCDEINEVNRMKNLSTRTHIIMQTDEVADMPTGFLYKLRGAFCKLTTSCLPLHGSSPAITHSVHGSSSTPPDLRPPHVLAQANAVSRGVSATTPITLPISSQISNCNLNIQRTGSSSSSINGSTEVVNNNTITNNNTLLAPTSTSNRNSTHRSPSNESQRTVSSNSGNRESSGRSTGRRKAPEPGTKKPAPPPPVRKASTTLSNTPTTAKESTSNDNNKVDNFSENLNLILKNQVMNELKANMKPVSPHKEEPSLKITIPQLDNKKEDDSAMSTSPNDEVFYVINNLKYTSMSLTVYFTQK